jgi:hypothetical protein
MWNIQDPHLRRKTPQNDNPSPKTTQLGLPLYEVEDPHGTRTVSKDVQLLPHLKLAQVVYKWSVYQAFSTVRDIGRCNRSRTEEKTLILAVTRDTQ